MYPLPRPAKAWKEQMLDNAANVMMWASVGLFLWATVLLAYKAVGWLQHGEWQQIPFGAIFIGKQGQDGLLMYVPNPMNLVPALGDMLVMEAVAYNLTPTAYGMQKITLWVLELPLMPVLFFSALGASLLTLNLQERSAATRRRP